MSVRQLFATAAAAAPFLPPGEGEAGRLSVGEGEGPGDREGAGAGDVAGAAGVSGDEGVNETR